jgi:hypothetical protein
MGPGRETIVGAIEAIGGVQAWNRVRSINATALVTLYRDGRDGHTTLQDQQIDVHAGTLQARTATPRGSWRAEVDVNGESDISGAFVDRDLAERTAEELVTLARRVRGPLAFLDGDITAGQAERVRIAGEDLIRVPVSGRRAGAAGCYFLATTHLLRYVTEGSNADGEPETVTVYTYMVHPNGLAFPQRIRVLRTGEFVLVGQAPLLDVQFTNVDF